MTFIQALIELNEGKKIRRASWRMDSFIQREGDQVYSWEPYMTVFKNEHPAAGMQVNILDIGADDWEVET